MRHNLTIRVDLRDAYVLTPTKPAGALVEMEGANGCPALLVRLVAALPLTLI